MSAPADPCRTRGGTPPTPHSLRAAGSTRRPAPGARRMPDQDDPLAGLVAPVRHACSPHTTQPTSGPVERPGSLADRGAPTRAKTVLFRHLSRDRRALRITDAVTLYCIECGCCSGDLGKGWDAMRPAPMLECDFCGCYSRDPGKGWTASHRSGPRRARRAARRGLLPPVHRSVW